MTAGSRQWLKAPAPSASLGGPRRDAAQKYLIVWGGRRYFMLWGVRGSKRQSKSRCPSCCCRALPAGAYPTGSGGLCLFVVPFLSVGDLTARFFPPIFNSETTLSFMLPLPLLMVTCYTSNTGFYCRDANCGCRKECLSPCSLEQATHSHGSEQWVKLACLQWVALLLNMIFTI